MKKKLIIVSGYFNPLHKGHLELFHKAKAMGNELMVIVNSDYQRNLKGSKEFQDENERLFIIKNLRVADHVIISIDKDKTQCRTLEYIYSIYGVEEDYLLAFANGGDQNNDTIPEFPTCEKCGIELIDGLGDKIQSSSWLLKK